MKTQRFGSIVLLLGIAFITSLATAGGNYAKAQPPPCVAAPIPGGGTITFSSYRDGSIQTYVMDGDECHLQKLIKGSATDWGATWSPDETQLVFVSDSYLYKMNADGSNKIRLVNNAPAGAQGYADWSPDGQQIAFQIDIGSQEIFVVNVDGTNLRQLTSTPGRDNYSPSWSPDSKQILFTSRRDPGSDGEAWVMNADGSNQHMIMPNNSSPDAVFHWSPDGSKIAFSSRRDGNWEIYVMNVDGSNQVRLTNNSGDDWHARWSPDSTRLVFYSNRDGNDEIYVMYADGTNQTRVTNNPAGDVLPVWGGPKMNLPPAVNTSGPYSVNEGTTVQVTATGNDPETMPLFYAWDLDDDGTFETPGQSVTFSAVGLDGPSNHTITVQVTDSGGLSATDPTTIEVLNVAPTVGEIAAPVDPVLVNTEISVSAVFTDPGRADTHTAEWNWGDGNILPGAVNEADGSGTVSGNHTYDTPGVYTIRLTVGDDDGGSGESVFQYVVVYDPDGGFVTGGGWIDSPPGACNFGPCTEDTTGKATFGFVSKYKKGAGVPTGNTEFQFKAGDLNFHSSSYEWLVVAGPKAQFKGEGAINGAGNYGFMLTALDAELTPSAEVDRFRIKIWDKDIGDAETPGALVYDNQMGAEDDAAPTTAIGGGNIVIHKK